ncbi:TetR/AcrR family transcriptional regulator [Aureivirga sp. CE67]|uniref:TetR/AcrR family transcriptional regulator n=1 Tax=Aureivirga sp. CE67 TaxID=1788983 RepID=UPI0018CB52D7|nr:TetR/AcrR family transcriptional regulator [Aureivirga sp. CE67]
MKDLFSNIQIRVNENIYLKNPESSDLGKKIISGSIDLIDEIGFESFTFRKLAVSISSTEASIYRYFESKHKLLLYLTAWYWAWMEYKLVFNLININSAEERLKRAVKIVTEPIEEDSNFLHINEVKLNRIVISESSKAYLTKEVDEEHKEGFFSGYENMVIRISNVILEINPSFVSANMLVSTVIEGAHHQYYFAEHLPKLTSVTEDKNCITKFYTDLVFKTIN